ncbi:MAG: sulfatase-like hydrolase/transferase [Verrucomicrobiota bacterium]
MKTFLAATTLLLGGMIAAFAASDRKPNVILIMADDLGYQDLGCYGHPSIRTPVLDQLAKDGMRLTNFHSGAPVCTPSRMALLTGAYPVRSGWTQGVAGYLMGPKDGLSSEALTIAEIFKAEGYATGISGKWHIGQVPETRPHRQGFDSAFYCPMSNNQLQEIWRDDEIAIKPVDNRHFTEHFHTEALRFIREHREKPFFLYLPHTAPHFPVEAHPDWKGKSNFGEYGDVVEELDARTGEMLKMLEELKLKENTIVIFISDNGGQGGEKSSNLPLRGSKWSPLEGGTRVPGIVSWPGKIPPNQTSDALVSAIDLLPTLCRATGINLTKHTQNKPIIDGVDIWEMLTGKSNKNPRAELLHWHGKSAKPQALTQGDWKLFLDQRDALTSADPTKKRDAPSSPALYNLREDFAEQKDLSLAFPDKVESLKQRANELLQELEASEKLKISTPE